MRELGQQDDMLPMSL